jgi:GNAT superfamily N-acetyltransferase
MLNIRVDKIGEHIKALKQDLRAKLPDLKRVMAEVEDEIRREVDEIAAARAAGRSLVPVLDFKDVEAGRISDATKAELRKRGVAVIRGVYPKAQAEDWNGALGDYLARNRYTERPKPAAKDEYFSTLKSDKPQIFGIYWSKPQMQARQHENSAKARAFMNRLWTYESGGKKHFDPDRECTYADRIRRRQPGDKTLGLSPHMDAGSVERWLDDEYRHVFRHVFSGNWRAYDAYDGAGRAETDEIPSPAVCSMFRSFQGWTALTPQGPGDGTLQVMPSTRIMVYLLLRPLMPDVPDDVLCGALPARAFSLEEKWHAPVMPALSPIPHVEPGDTVWWHPDIIHAVEDEHRGQGYSNVIYIAAAPWCAKNAAYLEKQAKAFLSGKSAPDFSAEDYEVDFEGRATPDDLTELGKKQMGLLPW